MNRLIVLALMGIVLLSCNRQLYKAHPNCTEYFDYIKGHWKQKKNGWYNIRVDKVDTTAAWLIQHADDPPVFIKQYKDNKENCLCSLNKKEVLMLFGKPTTVKTVFGDISKVQIERFAYSISDEKCDESAKYAWQPNVCGGMTFSFVGDTLHRGCTMSLNLWGWSVP